MGTEAQDGKTQAEDMSTEARDKNKETRDCKTESQDWKTHPGQEHIGRWLTTYKIQDRLRLKDNDLFLTSHVAPGPQAPGHGSLQ